MLNHQRSLPLNSLRLKSQEWCRTLSGWASTYQLSQLRYFPIDIPIDQPDLDRDPFPRIYYTVISWKQLLHVMYEDLSVEVIRMTISSWGSNIDERQTTLLYPVWISKSYNISELNRRNVEAVSVELSEGSINSQAEQNDNNVWTNSDIWNLGCKLENADS